MSCFNGWNYAGMNWSSLKNVNDILNGFALSMKLIHHPILRLHIYSHNTKSLGSRTNKTYELVQWNTNQGEERKEEQTMREFQGMVERSWLNKSVKFNSSTTQLSLSQSIIVLSKSKTTTKPAILLMKKDIGFQMTESKQLGLYM